MCMAVLPSIENWSLSHVPLLIMSMPQNVKKMSTSTPSLRAPFAMISAG